MDLLLIRHGRSTNNEMYASGTRRGRVPDPALSELGHRQVAVLARALAPRLHQCSAAWIETSPTIRTVQTAAPLARECGLPVRLRAEWVEGGGLYEETPDGTRRPAHGQSPSDLEALAGLPLQHDLAPDERWNGGFEPPERIADRARAVVETLDPKGPDRIVVTHEWFAQFVLRAVLDLPLTLKDVERSGFAMPNASVAVVRITPSQKELTWLGAPRPT